MNRKIKDWLIVLASLADDVAVVVLILLILWVFKITITWPIIIFLIAVFTASVFIVHRLVIPVLHRKKINGVEGMIGLEGKVVDSLNPTGLIKVGGEYWKARSTSDYIGIGNNVEVTGFDGLTLEVRIHVTK